MTEHQIQSEYFKILTWNESKYPELKYIFAIPNGGKRHIGVAVKMKREGVRRGVPDLFVPGMLEEENSVNITIYLGLFLETKKPKGRQSKEQIEYAKHLQNKGYKYKVCYSVNELLDETENYLQIKLSR